MNEPTVWDESVPHANDCMRRRVADSCECDCPKSHYCYDCDAQHEDDECPRTVLDDIVDALD